MWKEHQIHNLLYFKFVELTLNRVSLEEGLIDYFQRNHLLRILDLSLSGF